MKTSMKRIVCLMFALCMLVFAMSACGDKESASNNSAASSTQKPGGNSSVTVSANQASGYDTEEWANFDPYASIPAELKGTTVKYATWIDHWNTEGAMALNGFEGDTGLKIELWTIPQGNYVPDMLTRMAAGDYPDACVQNDDKSGWPITLQIAAPINKVSTVNLDEPIWDKSMLEEFTVEGNVYGVNTIGTPWSGGNMIIFNKTIFENNGFKTPAEYFEEGNWTWEAMLKCAKDVASIGSDYIGIVFDPVILAGSVGAGVINYDRHTHTFKNGTDNTLLVDVYEWMAEAKEQGYGVSSNVPAGTFKNGNVGMCTTGPYGLKATGYFINMDFNDIGFTYMPSWNANEQGKTTAIHRVYGVVDGGANMNGAGYFLRYWLDPANYDLDNTFISTEAGNFYYALIDQTMDNKYHYYDGPVAILGGYSNASVAWYNAINEASSAQVGTAIASVRNVVDECVAKANELVEQKIARDKEIYK